MSSDLNRSGRRGFIRGAVGASFVAAAPPLFAQSLPAGSGPSLDIDDPRERLRAYMLLRGALDEELVISCISCEYFGVVGGVMTPFYDLVAVTFSRFRKSVGGGFDAVSFEIEYFIDRQTGDVLDRWRNPYSGEIVAAQHNDSVPVRYRIEADTRLGLPPALLFAGSEIVRETPRFDVVGNQAFVRETIAATIPVPGAVPRHLNEVVTYHALVADLVRPGATRIESASEYLGVSNFRPWQRMGDRSGHMVGYGIGGSGLALRDVPPRWRAATKRLHPEALVDPAAYLEPLWKTL